MTTYIRNLPEASSTRIIRHTRYKEASDAIEMCISRAFEGKQDVSLMVLGDAGIGKTTLVREVLAKHPAVQLDGPDRRIHRPIVYAEIPVAPTPKSTLQRLLGGLGLKTRGTEEELAQQLITVMSVSGTKILLLDEAQHFIDRGRSRSWSLVADSLKTVVNKTGVTLLVFGLPKTAKLLENNDQLRRRFIAHHVIRPWDISSPDDVREFRSFTKALAATAGFEGGIDVLLERDFSRRLFFACNGRVGYLSKLIVEVADQSAKKGSPQITAEEIAAGFRDLIWKPTSPIRDPFSDHFNFKPLTSAGEPFSPVK